ncbi:TM0106 family RecB-like putative nuclease [Agrococcus sediminis]|uniref:TM0106 family RecB-like putative nuclease n=1 Tax=Agrococcus sediminis TaxID=2599924 RepID=A0A5M8QL56_9MICO|nr:bifunctional RecB family nuclease/DEAD/DEAH box helicase [Agrococcus sediminis]KAA6435958.1 TM0106 family RecB-like putative nuclease [Agrococcus sediminis]
MILEDETLLLTASDLTRASGCEWQILTALDAKFGRREPVPEEQDAMLERTAVLGDLHEAKILEALRANGEVVEIEKGLDRAGREAAVATTRAALARRAPVILQAAFEGERFFGYADFVELVDGEYVVSDAKLARRAKVTALLQLAAYARALRAMGAPVADEVRLLLGDGTINVHRLRDIEPVLLERRSRLEQIVDERLSAEAALQWGVDGVLACGKCAACEEQFASHDDLFQLAGIRRDQRQRLRAAGIGTVAALATAAEGPSGMAAATFASLQRQARAQLRSLDEGALAFEVVDPTPIRELPRSSPGDLFFDFEGDPLWQEGPFWGLDYLFGVRDASGAFRGFWAHSLTEEKQALVDFLDFVRERRAQHPDLHIYHYASYERTHLLSIAARHGVGEEEVDDLLRAGVLVDLYPVVKRSLVIGSASYSLKKLEPLYMPAERAGEVTNAGDSIVWFQQATELREHGEHEDADRLFAQIEDYNAYDVESTHGLRDWLRGLVPRTRAERLAAAPKELPPERAEIVAARERLVERLLARAGDGPAHRDAEQTALWLAAAVVGFHVRERKTFWWEHFSRLDGLIDEWRDQRDVVTVDEVLEVGGWEREPRKQSPSRRIRFRGTVAPGSRLGDEATGMHAVYTRPSPVDPDATTEMRAHSRTTLTAIDGDEFELVEQAGKGNSPWDAYPIALTPAQPPNAGPLTDSIEAWAERVAAAIDTDRPLPECLPDGAALDVLRRRAPNALATQLEGDQATITAIAESLCGLDARFVAVQGPPGTGKTYTGARVIARLVERGWRIGVVAQSHATVEHMLEGVIEAGVSADRVLKKRKDGDTATHSWTPSSDPEDELGAAGGVVGGTAWTFAGLANKRRAPLDLLVIDEAGQFSLANTIAAGRAAKRLLLIGDPQQLPQVSQGTHPAPVDDSALGWLCDGAAVVPPEFGYFLGTSWRMHPALCEAVSDLAYDGRLGAHESQRDMPGVDPGLVPVPVEHSGCTTASPEETEQVVRIVRELVGRAWIDKHGRRTLTAADVIVVAPYNAQVGLLQDRLRSAGLGAAAVGTVDRFQGREAAVVIVSLSASSAAEVPRGIEFLLSINRLNVAISRGQWLAYLVHSPGLRAHLPPTPGGVAQLSAFLRLLGRAVPARPFRV